MARKRDAPRPQADPGRGQERALEPSRADGDEHTASVERTATLTCADGHMWTWQIPTTVEAPCPHGQRPDPDHPGQTLDSQVDLLCPGCGATYTVVGRVGQRTCPHCGTPMVCPQCLAARSEAPPEDVCCPRCTGRPIAALATPPVTFRGDIQKVMP